MKQKIINPEGSNIDRVERSKVRGTCQTHLKIQF